MTLIEPLRPISLGLQPHLVDLPCTWVVLGFKSWDTFLT
jgi:hypothetical protein